MTNEIMKRESGWMTPSDLQGQVNLIQQVMAQVMKVDEHYGIIPGCKKPSLWKPGAEKLAMTFHLRPIIKLEDIIVDNLPGGHREVRVFCHIVSPAGEELATGVGSCSTMEAKYRYRGGEKTGTGRPIPKEYWNLKKEGKFAEAVKLLGGPGCGTGKVDGVWQICEIGEKAENPDLADCYNTVLKMAKKRAFVDGMLSATAASDIFTQDIKEEDDEPDPAPENGGKAKQEPDEPPAPRRKSDKVPAEKKEDAKKANLHRATMKMAEIAKSRDEDDKVVFVFTSADTGKKVYSYDEAHFKLINENMGVSFAVELDLSGTMPILKGVKLAPEKKDA